MATSNHRALRLAAGFPPEWSPAVRYPLASLAVTLGEGDAITALHAVAELARVLELDTDMLIDHLREGSV